MERKFSVISILGLPHEVISKFLKILVKTVLYSSHGIPEVSKLNFWSDGKRHLTLIILHRKNMFGCLFVN